jgi:hypothetical protein
VRGIASYDPGNPYVKSASQAGNFRFGPMGAVDFAGRLVTHAAKAARYHKWSLHRRLRPEAFGRNAAGVHYRTDGHEGLALGEALALNCLAENACAVE